MGIGTRLVRGTTRSTVPQQQRRPQQKRMAFHSFLSRPAHYRSKARASLNRLLRRPFIDSYASQPKSSRKRLSFGFCSYAELELLRFKNRLNSQASVPHSGSVSCVWRHRKKQTIELEPTRFHSLITESTIHRRGVTIRADMSNLHYIGVIHCNCQSPIGTANSDQFDGTANQHVIYVCRYRHKSSLEISKPVDSTNRLEKQTMNPVRLQRNPGPLNATVSQSCVKNDPGTKSSAVYCALSTR